MSSVPATAVSGQPPVSRNRLLVTSGLGWMFDAMDVGLLSFILAALKADWGLTPGQMGWIGAINSIGMAVGAIMFGMMADRIGRKHVFVITLLLFAIASGLSAFATTLAVLMVLRFFIGMGLGGELPVASTYVSERVPAHERDSIFRRFYRTERSRTTPGGGLGLALAAAVAELHGATIAATDAAPGLAVTVRFPQS